MKNFKSRGGGKSGFGSGRPGFRKPNFISNSGFRDRGSVAMHSAICAECGERCEVPFRPSGEKPVYCNNCFGGKRAGGNDRLDRRVKSTFSRSATNHESGNNLKSEIDSIISKLDQLTEAVQKLAERKTVPQKEEKTPEAKTKITKKKSVSKKTTKNK